MKKVLLLIVVAFAALFVFSCSTTKEKVNEAIDKAAEKVDYSKIKGVTIKTEEASYKYKVEWKNNVPNVTYAGDDEDKVKAGVVLAAVSVSGLVLTKIDTAAASSLESGLGKYVVTTTILSITTVRTYNSKLLLTKFESGSTSYSLAWK